MGKCIFKYQLSCAAVKHPMCLFGDPTFLRVQLQNDVMTMWALVDTEAEPKSFNVFVVGTGQAVQDEFGEYVDTVQQDGFVWHIFVAEAERF